MVNSRHGLVDCSQIMRPELCVSSTHATQITDHDSAAAIKEMMAGYFGVVSDREMIGPILVTAAHKMV